MTLEEIISSLKDQIADRESLIPKDEPDSIFAHDAEALREAVKLLNALRETRGGGRMKFYFPEIGTSRVVKRFPIKPLKLGTEARWLEVCYVRQHWNGAFWEDDWFEKKE